MPRPAPDHRTAPPRGDTAGVPRATGWAARRGPAVAGLFRAAFLRTQRAPFDALGSPVTYAVFATGLAWMWSWQAAQTMSVLRRILAMSPAHAGWPGPGLPRSASPATW